VDVDLPQLRAFVTVVDHGHFGRAAQSLTLTQQALSKRVARLEARLGPLLERRREGVVPTAAGARLLPRARQMLDLADQAVAELRGAPPPPLRVDVWGHLHPPAALVRAVTAEHPELVVEVSMRRSLVGAIIALQRHALDLAFGNVLHMGRALPSGLTAELVALDPIAALVRVHGALGKRDHLEPRDLARPGLWWPQLGTSPETRGFAEEYAAAVGAALITDGTKLGLDDLIDRVATGRAPIAPVSAGWPIPTTPDVRVVRLRPAPQYPWYAVWRIDAVHPALPGVLRWLRSRAVRPSADPGHWLPRGLEPASSR